MFSCATMNSRATVASCSSEKDSLIETYDDIVDTYILEHRDRANRELDFYRDLSSLNAAVTVAALAKTREGKRHPHQRRLEAVVLTEAERRLQACSAELRRCSCFADLYSTVEQEIGCICGIGPLMVYDVALRIGSYLGKEPEEVYLHRGTSTGARHLGLDHRRAKLDPAELPPAFQRLRPREVEDCLCIYKNHLRA